MPRSKRDKKISLTQTRKKGKDEKNQLIERVRQLASEHNHIFVLTWENMRNQSFKDLRGVWGSSQFVFGKNAVMQVALGRTESDAHRPGLNLLTPYLAGSTALFFTNSEPDDVVQSV